MPTGRFLGSCTAPVITSPYHQLRKISINHITDPKIMMSYPSRKSTAKEAIMRLTGDGVTDDAPYGENEHSSRDISVSSSTIGVFMVHNN